MVFLREVIGLPVQVCILALLPVELRPEVPDGVLQVEDVVSVEEALLNELLSGCAGSEPLELAVASPIEPLVEVARLGQTRDAPRPLLFLLSFSLLSLQLFNFCLEFLTALFSSFLRRQ